MQKLESDPDFIIISGDFAAHKLSDGQRWDSVSNVTYNFRHYFPNTTLIPSLGNNDVLPDYNCTCEDPQYQTFYSIWKDYIPDPTSFVKFGGYSTKMSPHLTVIVINTVLYAIKNDQTRNMSDPCGQFAWLATQLEQVAAAKSRAYIVGHIPIQIDGYQGKALWGAAFAQKFQQILLKYSPVIAGLFFGHTHTDDFRIVWEGPSMNHPIAAFLIAPSITPFYVNNPGFKKYHYDTLSAVPIDYEAHFMDLFVSNRQKQSNWQLEYQFSTAYGVTPVSPVAMAQLYTKMMGDDFLFQQWLARRSVMCTYERYFYLCTSSAWDEASLVSCENTYALA